MEGVPHMGCFVFKLGYDAARNVRKSHVPRPPVAVLELVVTFALVQCSDLFDIIKKPYGFRNSYGFIFTALFI